MEIYLEGLTAQEKAPTLREFFVAYCAYALKASNWSKQDAAKRIGIGRATMYRMVQSKDFKTFISSKGWSHHLEGTANATVT
jgi:transcriptional regulator of acetoin/glycerol metabolism